MGVLDDLKREAEAAKARDEEQKLSAEAEHEQAVRAVQPRVQALYGYFRDLAAQLDVLATTGLLRTYEVQGVGELKDLVQGEYKLSTGDKPERVERFAFHYQCARSGRREARITHRSTATHIREYLWANNLKFATRDVGDGSIILAIENRVPVSFEFSADYDRPGVRVRVRNLHALGTTIHVFRSSQVDEQFMDELAKEILGRPNRFGELCGNKLTETTRLRLRDQLAQIERERASEMSVPGAPEKKKRSLTAKLGRSLLRRKD